MDRYLQTVILHCTTYRVSVPLNLSEQKFSDSHPFTRKQNHEPTRSVCMALDCGSFVFRKILLELRKCALLGGLQRWGLRLCECTCRSIRRRDTHLRRDTRLRSDLGERCFPLPRVWKAAQRCAGWQRLLEFISCSKVVAVTGPAAINHDLHGGGNL